MDSPKRYKIDSSKRATQYRFFLKSPTQILPKKPFNMDSPKRALQHRFSVRKEPYIDSSKRATYRLFRKSPTI